MKTIIMVWFTLISVVFAGLVIAQDVPKEQPGTGMLTIRVGGFSNDRGTARIGLYSSNEDFKNKKTGKAVQLTAAPIKNKKAEWVIGDLPFGVYAVKVFHDENDSGKLETNMFGVPKEKYGFSNNARATFGPPDFEKARFILDKMSMTISITVE
ncbi:MAG: DUF2141 domain-containing protein [Proteobacteria bacterium]|nr:DUF2141 domain-containing protein [Pseudomonadota bacterium]